MRRPGLIRKSAGKRVNLWHVLVGVADATKKKEDKSQSTKPRGERGGGGLICQKGKKDVDVVHKGPRIDSKSRLPGKRKNSTR